MARLYTTGFELNSATSGVEGDTHNLTAISSTIFRSGAYSLRCNASSTTPFWRHQVLSADSSTVIGYLRAYLYIASLPSANVQILRFVTSANGPQCSIQLNTNGQLRLNNNLAVQIGSNSSALNTGQWYRLELSFNPATGAVDARIDGSSFASGSTATGSWSRVIVGVISSVTADLYFDDVAVNDNSGSFQNSFPGDGKYVHLYPNAAGDNNGFADGVPSSTGTDHYSNVDEVSPDGDTSYNQTATASQIEDYNIQSSSSAGIGASDTISVVHVGHRARKVTSGTMTYKLRAKAAAAGTVENSSNIAQSSTTYQTDPAATPFIPRLTMYDLPGASTTAWTPADIDTAQIGLETVSNTANNWRLTSIWMGVEYVPSGASGVTVNPAAQAVAMSLQAPTVTAKRNVTVSPAAQSSLFSLQAPTVRIKATPSPGVQSSIFSLQNPSVSTTRFVTASPPAQSSTFSIVAPTITAKRFVTVSPGVQAAAFSTVDPTVTAKRNASISPSVFSGVISLQSPTITAKRNVTVSPSAVSSSFSLQAPEVVVPVVVTVNPTTQALSFSLQAPSVSTTKSAHPLINAIDASFSVQAPTVTTYRSVIVSAAVVSLAFTPVGPLVLIPEERALDQGLNGFRGLRSGKPFGVLGAIDKPAMGASFEESPEAFIRSNDKPSGAMFSSKDKPRSA